MGKYESIRNNRLGRLTGVITPDLNEQYSYDRAGNRIKYTNDKGIVECYNYNEMNELLGIERISTNGGISELRNFTYDADGNMTSDGRGIYSYDGFNRMSEAVMEDGGKLICRYDAEGLRHETEENGRLIKFIYSGRDAVCEEDEDTGFTRYIRGNGRLVASDSESARTYYHYACDSLGSVDFVLVGNEFECDEICGDVKQRVLCRYKYDAFGNVTDSVENVSNRFGFTGEMLDRLTGQYYLRARYYVPEIGRFTQADTFHGDGLNLYVYAGNNPVRYVDPSGHCCKDCGVKSVKASDLPIIKKGTKEWDEAVKNIANGGNTSFRTKTATDAKDLLNEARGNMNRYKRYTSKKYKKGYEMHPNEINTRNAPQNDLPHVKWKDWHDKVHSGKGHIFFDIPN